MHAQCRAVGLITTELELYLEESQNKCPCQKIAHLSEILLCTKCANSLDSFLQSSDS